VAAVFGALGFVFGLGAAIYGYSLLPSLALTVFVFAAVFYLVGRALPDVITEERKAQRAAYFTLLPAVGAVEVYAGYLLWGGMWLAVILGFVAGGVAQVLLGRALFPRVREEEEAEELERAGMRPEE
jgi:fatty acid desaturase